MANIKKQLRKIRNENKFSQEVIADFLGVHRSTYSYYEIGTTVPSIDTLLVLQRIYNVSLDYLVNGREWSYNSLDITANATVSDYNPLSKLSQDERVIIACFRLLDDENKSKAVEFMKQFLKDSENEDKENAEEQNDGNDNTDENIDETEN